MWRNVHAVHSRYVWNVMVEWLSLRRDDGKIDERVEVGHIQRVSAIWVVELRLVKGAWVWIRPC